MITNASCTIYNQLSDGTFKRTVVPACFWRNVKSHEVKRYGEDNASSVSVLVPSEQLGDYVSPEIFNGNGWTADAESECYICKGTVDITPENISDVYTSTRDCYKVCSSVENLYGSAALHHIRIEGK